MTFAIARRLILLAYVLASLCCAWASWGEVDSNVYWIPIADLGVQPTLTPTPHVSTWSSAIAWPSTIATYTNCEVREDATNYRGYQTLSWFVHCDQGTIELQGRWEVVIEDGYEYTHHMGLLDDREPSCNYYYGRDPTKDQYRTWQKWCPYQTEHNAGWKLCGIAGPTPGPTP